ncbi:MAG: winged helix-turn-helix transcriptional regulator [Thermoplasmatota archaeon]
MPLEGLRARIYEWVQGHPGVHVLELAEALQLSHPTILYHLRILEDEGYVQTVVAGKRRCVFDTQGHFNSWERDVLVALQSEAGRVLELVLEQPGTFPRELAHTLGVSLTTVKRALPELTRLHLIQASTGFRKRLSVDATFLDRAPSLLQKLPAGEARVKIEALASREESRRAATKEKAARDLQEEADNRLDPLVILRNSGDERR